jgi:hypothetical protein
MKLLLVAFVALLVIVICPGRAGVAANSKPASSQPLMSHKPAPGAWGGDHIHAEISDSGVRFDFDCATGETGEPIVLDNRGRFSVNGTFVPEHGAALRRDENSGARSVRYAGNVKKQQMSLTITDSKTKEVIGSFTLRHGSEGRLTKCM